MPARLPPRPSALSRPHHHGVVLRARLERGGIGGECECGNEEENQVPAHEQRIRLTLTRMLESSLRFAPPPRRVPFSLGITTALNAVAQIGFGVLGFSSIFFWTFAGNADFSFITFVGPLVRATGPVTRVLATNAHEHPSPVDDNR